MHNDFKDITEKMGKPVWYDALGYPRYSQFRPNETSNIYADVVIYYRIACQSCREQFMVADSYTVYDLWSTKKFIDYKEKVKMKDDEAISDHILPFFKSLSAEDFSWFIHYGDPPSHGCVGDTMNCEDLNVVEFWLRGRKKLVSWERLAEFEITLPDFAE